MTNPIMNQYTKLEKFLLHFPYVWMVILAIPTVMILCFPIMDKGLCYTGYLWGGFTLFWFIYQIILNILVDMKKLYSFGRVKRFLLMCTMIGLQGFLSAVGFQSIWLMGTLSMAETQNMSAQVLDANIKETSKSPDRKWILKLSNGQTVYVLQPRNRSFKIGDTVPVSVRENQWGIWVKPNL